MEKKKNISHHNLSHRKSEEGQEKTRFFWEHCMPDIHPEINDSIQEKTFRKIEAEGKRHSAAGRNPFKTAVLTLTSIAASVAVLFASLHIYKEVSGQEDFKQIVAGLESLPAEEAEEVTLVVSDEEQHTLQSDAQISYTPSGNVSVNSRELEPVKKEEAKEMEESSSSAAYNQLIVPKGKRSQLILSEGTKVWVNSGTKVVYPRVFNKKKREIYVEGEVYLEVTPDADRPFYVNTDGFEIKVLGTAFDVFAYKQMDVSKVTLVKGSVEIKDRENRQMRMVPNELVLLEQNNITEKKTVNAADYITWIGGVMILNGERLTQLAERLSLLHGKRIICDSSLDNEQVYGKLDLRDNLDDIIDFIRSMIPLSVEEKDEALYLTREK